MNLTRIKYFLTFCETLHFTNAARALGISQPALTKAISLLEKDLGTRLIRREGKFTHLTRNGETTRNKFESLMQAVDETEKDVRKEIHGTDDLIKFGIVRSIDFTRIAHFLTEFHRSRPSTQFEIIDCHVTQCLDLLLTGDVDCVLTIECEEIQDRFRCIELYEELFGVVTNMEYPTKTIAVNYEHREEITGHKSIDLISRIYEQSSVSNRCLVQCSQELWLQQLVKAGLGFGVTAVSNETIHGVQIAHNPNFAFKRQIYAALPVGRNDTPLFSTFVRFLEQHHWHHPAISNEQAMG